MSRSKSGSHHHTSHPRMSNVTLHLPKTRSSPHTSPLHNVSDPLVQQAHDDTLEDVSFNSVPVHSRHDVTTPRNDVIEEMARARYVIQNKKLLEQLEARTYELHMVKTQQKELSSKYRAQGSQLATFDQRILALEAEIRSQDKKLREAEAKLAQYEDEMHSCRSELGSAREEARQSTLKLETCMQEKRNLERQRSEAIKNLEEMARSMADFRSHTKAKLVKSAESESKLKSQVAELTEENSSLTSRVEEQDKTMSDTKSKIQSLESTLKLKEESVCELQKTSDSLREKCKQLESTLQADSNPRTSDAEGYSAETFRQENEELKRHLTSKDVEIENLRRRLNHAPSENVAEPDLHNVALLEAEKSRLTKRIRELEACVKSRNSELDSVKSQLSLWSSQYDEAKSFINANDHIVNRLERDLRDKNKTIEQCRLEMNELSQELEDTQKKNAALEGRVKRQNNEIHGLKCSFNETYERLEECEQKMKQSKDLFADKEEEYQSQLEKLHLANEELQASVNHLQRTVQGKDSSISQLQSHFDSMLPNLEAVKGELTSLNVAHHQLKEQSAQMQQEKLRQISQLEETIGVYKKQLESAENQMNIQKANSQQKVSHLEGKLKKISESYAKLKDENKRIVSELSERESNIKQLQSQIELKDGTIADHEAALSNLLEEKSDLLRKNSEDHDLFEKKYSELQSLYTQLSSELEGKQNCVSELKEEVAAKDESISKFEEEVKVLNAKSDNLLWQINVKNQENEDALARIVGLNENVQKLEAELDEKCGEAEKLSSELKQAKHRCTEVDRAFSDYYTGSQEMIKHNKMLQEKIEQLRGEAESSQKVIDSKTTESAHLKEQMEVLQNLLSEKQISCANKQQRILELERNLQITDRDKSDAVSELSSLREMADKSKALNSELEDRCKLLQNQLLMRDDQLSMRDDKIEMLSKKLEGFVQTTDTHMKKSDELSITCIERNEQIAKLTSELANLRDQLQANESQLSKRCRENTDLEDKVKKMSSEVMKLNADKQKLANELCLKSSTVESLMTKVEEFETKESKLQTAVTQEISRLKQISIDLSHQYNQEIRSEQEKFQQALSSRELQLQRAVDQIQQLNHREQILRSDLARAFQQIEHMNPVGQLGHDMHWDGGVKIPVFPAGPNNLSPFSSPNKNVVSPVSPNFHRQEDQMLYNFHFLQDRALLAEAKSDSAECRISHSTIPVNCRPSKSVSSARETGNEKPLPSFYRSKSLECLAAPSLESGRTFVQKLKSGDELRRDEQQEERERKISVQELSMQFNNDEEGHESVEEDSVVESERNFPPDRSLLDQSDADRMVSQSEDDFTKMLAENNEKRKKLEEQLNHLVKQASIATGNSLNN